MLREKKNEESTDNGDLGCRDDGFDGDGAVSREMRQRKGKNGQHVRIVQMHGIG